MSPVIDELRSSSPWVLQFAGQSSPWRRELNELLEDPRVLASLTALDVQAEELLAPVLPELTVIGAGRLDLLGRRGPAANTSAAIASVPGVLLAQYGAYLDVEDALAGAEPTAVIGHSQGILAAAMISSEKPAGVLALARIIGAAATRVTREVGASRVGETTPMLSIRGVPRPVLADILAAEGLEIAIANSHTSAVVSGIPARLAALVETLEQRAAASRQEREAKRTGGAPLAPICEFLDVDTPFHSQLLADALRIADEWISRCDLGVANAHELASAVLIDPLAWDDEVAVAVAKLETPGGGYVIDLGPGSLQRLTLENLAGSGVTYVDAGTAPARDQLVREWRVPPPRRTGPITPRNCARWEDERFSTLRSRGSPAVRR
ncbi:hypothetical protein [Actinobaculum sp. 313]|uniref:hypothetical protein n=1 Tax=Actinobaculum sp. 313 TaxID=2495645 RepID=UPI001F0BF1EC|nr:hypothetical protein [Actinobaculum sp. 313]